MIRFERASFVYRADAATSERGVHDVSISVRPGQVAVVCGRSGCGKSTLLRMANGLAPRFFPGRRSGRVLLDDEDVGGLAAWEIAERAGSLFQNPRTQFFNVDTTGEVAFALENAGWPSERIRARVERTLRELGLEDLADRSIFRLSGGQRQKIAYASVWALRPANLLLDEPTSNLDADSIEAITAFVAAAKTTGRSILVAEHRLTWLSGLADTYIHLDSGRITHGSWTPWDCVRGISTTSHPPSARTPRIPTQSCPTAAGAAAAGTTPRSRPEDCRSATGRARSCTGSTSMCAPGR